MRQPNRGCDQLIGRRRHGDCVFHKRRAAQNAFKFGGFDPPAIDLQLASFASDDPQQSVIIQLDDVTRRKYPQTWIIRV
jgi:hypothetical protein